MRALTALACWLSLAAHVAGSDPGDCSGCDQVDWSCEYGSGGCVAQAELCGSQCCQGALSWLVGCKKCRDACETEEQACITSCRASLTNCHSGCDLTCCDTTMQCFPMTAPFVLSSWPEPQCHNPAFRLYRSDISGWQPVTHASVPAQYNSKDSTIILVHGWRTKPDADWVQTAKDAFLSKGDYNVVVVDWQDGADELYYPQSASNVRVTGAEIASIVKELQPPYVWCVGESLGAHSCGHAGKLVPLNRITGLDPAGPMFELDSCSAQAEICRLHHTDADQVDCIHTDAKDTIDSYGTNIPMGTIDFFPNGNGRQPGCPPDGLDLGCNHMIVREYFVESILSDCFITEKQCTNEKNLPGSCIDCEEGDCPNMGASTSFGRGIYYLTTKEKYPFCKG